ncbi:hypothetical protein BFP97_10600 [Roseivirga sp. 4D4]|uniref:fasciclin domain-containing protein n=1 Tax=Roseivirga sp. 4D4 TaxID=1889784 RepID=UPI00085339DA|nr:fasciclin domain-containing protein [Roseivirga sp. 4D4]OEK01938.1 hypothetical protein BFP97_10600 [Roseivirga sp. 4D4]
MKLDQPIRHVCLLLIISASILLQSCGETEETSPEDDPQENIGTLIMQSAAFSEFAALITIADREIPQGETGVLQMLNESDNLEVTVFAPSNEVFELLAVEWSSPNFQATVADVIDEFTHSGQPAKTRDFLLGHIFKSDERYERSSFQTDLSLESEKGIWWRMIAAENATSGFGFVLENSSANANPYFIYETDVLTGNNGIVHAALVN